MLDELYVVEESELPPLTDAKMVQLGQEFGRRFMAFDEPTAILRREIWPACWRAFQAICDDMPFIPSMKFIDNGMLGDAGVRTAIKDARNNIISGVLPTDESWLEPASLNAEDNSQSLDLVKNLLIQKFEAAQIRDTGVIAIDQLLAIGTTGIGIRWDQVYQARHAHPGLVKGLKGLAKDNGLVDADGNPLHKSRKPVKYWKKVFDGPIVYPIDMQRLWLDPNFEQGKDRDKSWIYLTFKTLTDLKSAKDPDTEEPLYDPEILKDLTEITYQQFYAQNGHLCSSTKLMGIDPGLEVMGKFIPIYIFYQQILTTEDEDVYVDKFFYVAHSGGRGGEWKIIRVQDNPSAFGDAPFYTMGCDPALNTPYGVGLAEKSISVFKAKNIIDRILLNAGVLALFPPSYHVGNVLKDGRKPRYMPGGSQEIVLRPGVGMEWISPYPTINPNNSLFGLQESRYMGERIVAAVGQQSAGLASDPTKSLSKEQTATEIKQVAADGNQSGQIVVDRVNQNLMEPLANAMHNMCRQHYTEPRSFVVTDKNTGTPTTQNIDPAQLDRDRQITIVGRRALANKAQMIPNLQEVLKILALPEVAQVMQNLPIVFQDTVFKLIAQLGMPIKDEYRVKPEEIFAKEPQVMQAAIQNALQNPEMRIEIGKMLLQSPEGQQLLMEIKDHVTGKIQTQMQSQMPPGGRKPAALPAPGGM